MVQTVAVTGASSFIGVHLVDALLSKGYHVRALTRNLADEGKVGPLRSLAHGEGQLTLMAADVQDQAALETAFQGCDGVMHLAVPHPQHGGKPVLEDGERDELLKTAVTGAVACLTAAHKTGVKKVVYTSSLAAVECGNEGTLDETCWSAEAIFAAQENRNSNHFQYVAAKTMSEQQAWSVAKANDLALTVICPGNLVIGDVRTNHINGTMQHVADICNGKNTLLHHADIAPVNVKDVCSVHVAALESDYATGKRFLCAPYMISSSDLIQMIQTSYPKAAEPPTTAPDEDVIVGKWGTTRATSNKLSELGIKAVVPLEDTVKASVESLMAKGYVRDIRKDR